MKIVVVDDEKNIRESLKILLEQEGFSVDLAENGLSAQRIIMENSYDAAIVDLKMPGLSGLDLLEWIKSESIGIKVIMISAFGQVEDAVNALKRGALDYIVKPFDPELLIEKIHTISEAIERNGKLSQRDNRAGSSVMRKLDSRVERIAKSNSTVLITGESGVGKEVTARKIHQLSSRSNEPFLALNMGGITETLTESELFGYEKGAFTGADSQKKGLLEQAGNGTLFLDEVGEMPMTLQVKLLRVLQDKKFRRLGGVKDISINSRLITATNRDLEGMVKAGLFREDLFYRLNIARLSIPPLRERREELIELTGTLLGKLNKRMGLSVESLSSDAWNVLLGYTFPGNIRELENILERAMIFVDGNQIEAEDIELPQVEDVSTEKSYGRIKTLKEVERESIIQALQRWEGNRSKVADELGVSRRTIINKIKEYGLD